ncbi:MAG: pseudouridine-5'-phosphate glycosidase [Anaerolineae bacterium]
MDPLRVERAVAEALEAGRPVVALESALITHGFSAPKNLSIAQRMEAAVRDQGVVPATAAVLDGQARIGLRDEEIARLASADRRAGPPNGESARKISLRDLPSALAQGASGGTTVAATIHLAHLAGIKVFATGGIGGVHRGLPEDISADLTALASVPITVVCSGAKAILDLPRTREALETRGIAVVGYGTDAFPGFYSRSSGLKADAVAHAPQEVARMARVRTALKIRAALLVCVPVPEDDELPPEEAETVIGRALDEAERMGVRGKDVTPFLLAQVVKLTDGRAQRANEALLVNNARVAALVAQAACRN